MVFAKPLAATVIDWLDQHAVGVTALSTVVLACITAVYVFFTYSLVREQRRQRSRPSVAYELGSAPEKGVELHVRNLGNGHAANLALVAGPRASVPSGIEIGSLGAGFSLAPFEKKTWLVRASSDVVDADVPLLLTYMNNDHDTAWFSCFLIRVRGDVAHTSASFDDHLGVRRLKSVGRRSMPLARRPGLIWKQRRLKLAEAAMVDPTIREALSDHLQKGQIEALEWEVDFLASQGEI